MAGGAREGVAGGRAHNTRMVRVQARERVGAGTSTTTEPSQQVGGKAMGRAKENHLGKGCGEVWYVAGGRGRKDCQPPPPPPRHKQQGGGWGRGRKGVGKGKDRKGKGTGTRGMKGMGVRRQGVKARQVKE